MTRNIILMGLLLASSVVAYGETALFEFTYAVEDYPTHRITESLMEGHKAEVLFEIRVLRKVSGIRKLFGDSLLFQKKITHVARWDPLDDNYIIRVDDLQEFVYDDPSTFLESLLSLHAHTVNIGQSIQKNDYVMCRSRIQPIKLIPPLSLMTIFRTDLSETSSWTRVVYRRNTP